MSDHAAQENHEETSFKGKTPSDAKAPKGDLDNSKREPNDGN